MRNDEPLISVIVPVSNGQDYLENCIRSIEGQTYGNLEVIIVNNGSTDHTDAVCDRLERGYRNVRVLTSDVKGVSAARNAGVKAARGELITFVDADDRLCSEVLRVLYECMTDTGSDVAGCGFFTWSSEKEWQQGSCAKKPTGQTVTYDTDTYLKEALLCGNSRCWSKLYHRELFDKVRFPENLAIGEDLLFLVRMLPYVGSIAETNYTGYGYFSNLTGAMNREFTPQYMDQVTCWQLARNEILQMNPNLDAQVTALYMMGIMLTVGKIAMLSVAGRRAQKEYIQICHEKMKETMQVLGAYNRLSVGYRLKTRLFMLNPNLYLFLYHLQKTVR